ncbi:MAG TPA: UDP-N-acetylmuramoyl-L-alanine--D-glutamate ligase [Thiotrichales bacterium]|nr:UDP-N-acetylmuramoyl-L-alanine--D-glutamate ligase [Thiotrichales bacterium]
MAVKPEQAVYTLVVGLGRTGLSVVSYLRSLGEPVIVVDSRDIPPGLSEMKLRYPEVEVHTGAFDARLFLNAQRIVVSPGVPMAEPALVEAHRKNIEITGDIDLFAHEVYAPVIGITGSNGKSTVTLMVTAMARQCGLNAVACGNIGTPVLDALADDVELYVMELSSFQLETLQRLPMKASVVLNISADHLDRYENLAAYAMSKQAIYDNAQVQVVNRDDALAAVVNPGAASQLGFTLGPPQAGEFGLVSEGDTTWLCLGEQKLLAADALKIRGRHNLQNALAALALAHAAGLPLDGCIEALKAFEGLPHRVQFVARINDIDWINDSKATNVGATIAALTGLPGRKVLIAGGQAKGADFSALSDVVRQHCRGVVLMGQDSAQLLAAMPEGMAVKTVSDMHAAVQAAGEMAQPGDSVLLAPACASFDIFNSFEHRGEVFIEAVNKLKRGEA